LFFDPRITCGYPPPSTFRWGARLRKLHSTRVAFPALPGLLSPSTSLVDLQLHEIPNVGYFPPEAFANSLSGLTQLETLSLHFLSFPPRRNHVGLPPQPEERVVLPALAFLKYRGTSKYLDSFVARIDAPRLGNIDITFFSQPTMDASQLGRFIERIEIPTSLSHAEIQFTELSISISFSTQPDAPTRLELRIPCKQLDWQLSSIAQICDHFSPFTFRVENLHIKEIQLSSRQIDMDLEQWLKLFCSFRGVKDFYADDEHVTENCLFAMGQADREHRTVLPSLRTLHIPKLEPMHGSLSDAVESLTTSSRRLYIGRVEEYDGRSHLCKICQARFTEQKELKKHLVVMHAYRLVCPYCHCGDFEFAPRYSNLFREHLANKHPEVAHTETLILNPSSQSYSPSYSGSDGTQNNDTRASVNFGAFTKFIALHVPWTGPEIPAGSQIRLVKIIHFLPLP